MTVIGMIQPDCVGTDGVALGQNLWMDLSVTSPTCQLGGLGGYAGWFMYAHYNPGTTGLRRHDLHARVTFESLALSPGRLELFDGSRLVGTGTLWAPDLCQTPRRGSGTIAFTLTR